MSEDTNIENQTIPEPVSSRRLPPVTQIALVLAVIAICSSGWLWLEQRQQGHQLEKSLALRLSEFDERSRAGLTLAKRADEGSAEAAAKIALLEQKLEESRAQQQSLQTLYLELASNRDAWTISEAEQLVIIASQQLQLAGNVKPALLALQTADNRLQELDKPQIIQLRKIINRDIQKLQALPSIDIVGMSLKLDALADAADKLPLASIRHPRTDNTARPDWDSNPWHRLAQEVWQDIQRMVRVEHMDHPETPMLAPEQNYFLRENLKLRLLDARIALLQHDEATYRTDLQTAALWIKRYFDVGDASTRNALDVLQQLSSSSITIQLPDISESLNAVAKYKLALERSK
jgi:uroporphyrin-III C-methyltransferase